MEKVIQTIPKYMWSIYLAAKKEKQKRDNEICIQLMSDNSNI